MKYLKYFETEAGYASYKNGSDFITPNVSYIVETNDVQYTRGDFIIMTSESNPEVMKVCYNQGWAASPYEMYASEAASVTSIGTAFEGLGQGSSSGYGEYEYGGYSSGYGDSSSSFTFTFDEFKYFTGVTTLEYNAFYGSKIVSITIPDSVTSIGESAFISCNDLTSITIPDSVTSIGYCAFANCSGLNEVHIGSGVTEIRDYVFQGCSGLTSITIPDSVTSIGYSAFQGCSSLNEVHIGSGVTSIEADAFQGCSELISIVIPDSITSIGYNAFYNCSSLTSVVIPDSVTTIGESAFYNCSGLTSITCLATTAPSIYYSTFDDIASGGVLKVPAGSDYSSWMSTNKYYLGYYNWTVQEI
jgi:hypothetical protein